MSRSSFALALTFSFLCSACGDSTEPGTDSGPSEDAFLPGVDGDVPPPDPDTIAILEVHAMDIWAQDLPADEATLTVTSGTTTLTSVGWPIVRFELRELGRLDLTLTADHHEDLEATITFDGTAALDGLLAFADADGSGVSVSHAERTIGGRTYTVHTIYLGARHLWFSAQGRPARRGNRVRLMTSGEEAWEQVARDLLTATETIHMATWWWESDFELVRDPATHVASTTLERELNTIISLFDDADADKRVLVGQFLSQDGIFSNISSDAPLQDRGAVAGDRFEFMGQVNPTRGMFRFQVAPFSFRDVLETRRPELMGVMFDSERPIESRVPPHEVDLTAWPISLDLTIGSYHQKFVTIDGRVAFVGGMNLRRVDWDTDDHLVFEPRRMGFDSTTTERMAVVDRESLPDTGPRKDYMTRIEGPLVQDVDELFRMRWSYLRSEGVDYAENASDFDVRRDQVSFPDGVQAQLTATLPAPFDEHAIAETWFNAIDMAEEYILIEDQYFRIPMLVDAIIERMTMVPGLQLIVITKPVNEFTDPGCEWTARTHQDLRTFFPTRYALYTLRSWDYVLDTFLVDELHERFAGMDIHSKLLIVDDVFLSVGSCNKNNRGLVYEGELNLAVFDRAWVTTERRRILEQLLPPGTSVSDVPSEWITQIAEAASWNQFVWDNWDAAGGDIVYTGGPPPMDFTPEGFFYQLDFDIPSECLIEGVGPDMT